MLGLFCEQNMAIQTANLGTAPSGAGGDTFRSAATKFNENFTNNAHAASRLVGTQAGNVMEVGAFGVGSVGGPATFYSNINIDNIPTGFYSVSPFATGSPGANGGGNLFVFGGENYQVQFHRQNIQNQLSIRFGTAGDLFTGWGSILISGINATTDPNGFIKSASPVVNLFSDKIKLNSEAQLQDITFEKLGVGDYLIKGSSGFAQEGWYIETPKDANGNVLVAVVYEQLENGDISVKTYDYMLNKKGRIIADIETPLDIPKGRWIDLRLQELPQPEIEIPESMAPPEFQTTGLAQAVATVMESYHDPEQ